MINFLQDNQNTKDSLCSQVLQALTLTAFNSVTLHRETFYVIKMVFYGVLVRFKQLTNIDLKLETAAYLIADCLSIYLIHFSDHYHNHSAIMTEHIREARRRLRFVYIRDVAAHTANINTIHLGVRLCTDLFNSTDNIIQQRLSECNEPPCVSTYSRRFSARNMLEITYDRDQFIKLRYLFITAKRSQHTLIGAPAITSITQSEATTARPYTGVSLAAVNYDD
jgi:hypothetical protein